MNTISNVIKVVVQATVKFLNAPPVKETVKNTIGVASCVFGAVEAYDLYQIARGRVSTEPGSNNPKWIQVAEKVIIICSKISLLLSAGVSRPGVFVVSSLVGLIFSTTQLDKVFGPNTTFAVNPWHPRHVISFVAVLFALPSVVQSAGKAINWGNKKIQPSQTVEEKKEAQPWLTRMRLRLMVLFNTIFSRPVLHKLNLCFR